ncbi:MAG: Asp-tRNA(Asn)/Glu-tRNA(Gln) amidotransferase subunit GatC [Candidatus Saccharimonadales bacterium]
MTKLTRQEVLKLAKLAHLELTEAEISKFQTELSEILDYVAQLQDVDTKGLEPTYQVTGLNNVTRRDEVVDYGVSQADLLKNLPAREGNQIKVKRVL